jgi:hypothetical protein
MPSPLTFRRLPRRGQRRIDILPWMWRMRWFAVAVAASALVFYGLLWLLFARASARTGDFLEQTLGGKVQVQRVHVTRGFRVDLYGIKVYEPGQKHTADQALIEAQRISVWPEWTSLLTGRMKPRRIEVWAPRLHVRRLPDGRTSMDHWVKRATKTKTPGAARAFPALVEIHDGSIFVQLTAGPRQRHAFLLIEHINGRAGRAPKARVALDFKAAVFGSQFSVRGLMAPDAKQDIFSIKLHAPFFAYSELADLLRLSSSGALNSSGAITLGTGRLDAEITGALQAPRVSGAAALRDFDADFVFENNLLSLSNIKAGAGANKVTGSATLDCTDPNLPFLLELDIRALDLAAMLNPAMGFQFAPQGMLGGVLRVNGALAADAPPKVSGRIDVRGGILHFPLLRVGPGPFPYGNVAALPFERLGADFTSTDDSIRIEKLHVAGAGYSMDGSAVLGAAPASLAGFNAPFTYSVDLAIAAPDLGLALSNVPAWQGLAAGALKGSLHLEGDLGRTGSAAGAARFTVSRGMIYNPYYISGRPWAAPSPEAPFEQLTCHVRLENKVLFLSGSLSDNGLDMSWDGRADTETGALLITGTVDAATDAADRFQGLAPYVQPEPLSTFTNYKAAVRVSGSLHAPITTWSRPHATRWRPAPRD